MKRLIGSTIATLAFIGGSLAMTATTAHATCSEWSPGYAKRTTAAGAIEFYEDARCGFDPNRFSAPPGSTTQTTHGCRTYPEGELCGSGIGTPRGAISYPAFIRLYAFPGGSTAIGHVTVGEAEDITDEDTK